MSRMTRTSSQRSARTSTRNASPVRRSKAAPLAVASSTAAVIMAQTRTTSAPPYIARGRRRPEPPQPSKLAHETKPARATTTSPVGMRKSKAADKQDDVSKQASSEADETCKAEKEAMAQQMQLLETRYTRLAQGLITAERQYVEATLQAVKQGHCDALAEALAEAAAVREARIARAARRKTLAHNQAETVWQAQQQAAHLAFCVKRGEMRMQTRQAISAEMLAVGREYGEMAQAEVPGMHLAPELLQAIQQKPLRVGTGPGGGSRMECDEDLLMLGLKPTERTERWDAQETLSTAVQVVPVQASRKRKRKRADSTLIPYTQTGKTLPVEQVGPLPSLAQLMRRESQAAAEQTGPSKSTSATAAPPAPKPKLHHTYFMPPSQPGSHVNTPRPSRPGSPARYSYPYASASAAATPPLIHSQYASPLVTPATLSPQRKRASRDLWVKTALSAAPSRCPSPERVSAKRDREDRRVSLPWEMQAAEPMLKDAEGGRTSDAK